MFPKKYFFNVLKIVNNKTRERFLSKAELVRSHHHHRIILRCAISKEKLFSRFSVLFGCFFCLLVYIHLHLSSAVMSSLISLLMRNVVNRTEPLRKYFILYDNTAESLNVMISFLGREMRMKKRIFLLMHFGI